MTDIAARIADLRRRIEDANRRYHELDDPDLTDAQYDALVRELEALERAHPQLAAADSPTRKVGAAPSVAVDHAAAEVALGALEADGRDDAGRRPRPGHVEDRQRMAFPDDVARHGRPHDAQSDESEFHGNPLFGAPTAERGGTRKSTTDGNERPSIHPRRQRDIFE